MSLFNFFRGEAESADDTPVTAEQIDSIVEYLTDRMGGIDERMGNLEGMVSDINREKNSRTDALYSELW